MFKKFITIFLILNMFCKVVLAKEFDIKIEGKSAILIEENTGRVLYEKNADKKIYPASMTKILTALVALDYIDRDEVVIAGSEIYEAPMDSSRAGHIKGEHITGINLIRGLIIPSGNDTGCIVAVNVAKKITGNNELSYKEYEQIFADIMNEKAKKLGAVNSNFTNPHGYHDENLYSTVRDIAIISMEAMKKEVIATVASEIEYKENIKINNTTNNGLIEHNWVTHNLLLNSKKYFYKYATGLKTGFTNTAGYCLSASAEKDKAKLITVIANSGEKERWEDAIKLFEYGFNNFKLKVIVSENEKIKELLIKRPNLGTSKSTYMVSKKDFIYYLSEEEEKELEKRIIYNKDKIISENDNESIKYVNVPISKNDVLGKMIFSLYGEDIYELELNCIEDIEKRTLIKDINFILNLIKNYSFTIYAIPYWILSISLLSVIINIIKILKKRKLRRYSRYKNINQKKKRL